LAGPQEQREGDDQKTVRGDVKKKLCLLVELRGERPGTENARPNEPRGEKMRGVAKTGSKSTRKNNQIRPWEEKLSYAWGGGGV